MNLRFILPTVQADQASRQYCSELTYQLLSALPAAVVCCLVCLAKQTHVRT